MSEYWKSTPKYYCKHCKMFVVDTPVSKKNHDASMKHQGALKRFLRDLHRTNEREQAAASAAKREVARLNALVGPSVPPPTPTYNQPASDDARKRQLKELEALGVALPEHARRELAMVGDWEESVKVVPEKAREVESRKRGLDEEKEKEKMWNEMDVDERAIRGFRIQTKRYPGEDAGDFDPGVLFKGKGKGKTQEIKAENGLKAEVKEEDGATAKEDGAVVEKEDGVVVKEDVENTSEIKTEAKEVTTTKDDTEVKREDPAVGDGVVFKKRKVKNIRKK